MSASAGEPALRVFVRTAVALNHLKRREDTAFREALAVARDPRHVPGADSLPVLASWKLTDGTGTMHDDVRAAVLSSRYAQEEAA